MDLHKLFKQSEKLVLDNSPAILTGIGVTGTVSVAYLTGRASFQAVEVIRAEQMRLDRHEKSHPLDTREKVLLVWKLYVPAALSGSLTVAAIIAANRIGTRRTAALAAAYTLSEKAYEEYKEKVIEKIGHKKEEALRSEVAQDQVNRKQPAGDVIITGIGDVLFRDSLTGRYFQSTVETVKKAQNDTNYQILHDNYASLSDFFDRIGLSATEYSEEVGWNVDKGLELMFSTVLTEDNRPCISMDYVVSPIRGYSRLM